MALEQTEPAAAKTSLQTSESIRIAVRKAKRNITGMMMYILLQRLYVRKNTSISSDGRCDVQTLSAITMSSVHNPRSLTLESSDWQAFDANEKGV